MKCAIKTHSSNWFNIILIKALVNSINFKKGLKMKKTLIFIFILPVYLLALNVEQTYSTAMKAYNAKDYQTSYELLSKLYLTKLSDVNLNFNLGRSAYETGHYEAALAAFERVEMLDSTNFRNKLEKARTYFMLKMYEDSELTFKEVLANPMIPQNVRSNIELYMSKVSKAQQKSFTYVSIAADILFDSNVNYGSINDTYTTEFFPNVLIQTPNEISDRALQASANIVNIYDIGDSNGFALKNSASLYMKDYQQENPYDIKYAAYTPSLVYKYTKYTAEMLVGVDVMGLGNELYLKTFSLTPKFMYEHTNSVKSMTHLKYQRKFFQQTAQYNLNADHYELSYGLQDVLSPRSYTQANLTATQEKKHHGMEVGVNYKEYKLDAVYANQFTPTYGAQVYAELRKRNYDDRTIAFGSTREDVGKSIGATVTAKILETLSFNIKTTYNKVDSNQELYSYKKYTASAGLVKTF